MYQSDSRSVGRSVGRQGQEGLLSIHTSTTLALSFLSLHALTPLQAAEAFRQQHAVIFRPLAIEQEAHAASFITAMEARSWFHAWGQGIRTWAFKFGLLLARNLRLYIRNPGNVIGRFIVYLSVGIASGIFCWGIGRSTGPRAANDMMGAYVRCSLLLVIE